MTEATTIQRVTGGITGLQPDHQIEMLANTIYTNTLSVLNIRNDISGQHDRLIHFLSSALAGQCLNRSKGKSSLAGRYAYDIDTGLGKSVSVLATIKSIYQLRLDTSLLIANGQIAENCKIIRQLIDIGVPAASIGICHSKDVSADDPVYLPATAPSQRQSKQFLFICHARFDTSAYEKERWLLQYNTYRSQPRTLVIYDESIQPALPVAVDFAAVSALVKHVSGVKASARPDEKRALSALSRQAATIKNIIVESSERLAATGERQIASVESEIGPADMVKLKALLHSPRFFGDSYRKYTDTARAILDMCGYSCRLVHIAKSPETLTPYCCGLTRYLVIVPDELSNIAVLDANFTADKLIEIDKSVSKHPGFAVNQVDHVKRYDNLVIHRANMNTGIGRLRDEWAKFATEMTDEERAADTYRNACISKYLENPTIPTIFVAHKNIPTSRGNIHFSDVLDAELDYYGVPEDVRAANVHVVTWNSHTGANHLSHCRRVIFCSMFNLPLMAVAFNALAMSQNLHFDFSGHVSIHHMKAMVKVCYFYQAVSRCCIRNVLIDMLGRTQAQAAEVWMADEHDKEQLDEHLPNNLLIGASMLPWAGVGKPPSKSEHWRKVVSEFLQMKVNEWVDEPVVFTTKELKQAYPELNGLTKTETNEFAIQCKQVLADNYEWSKHYQTWTYQPFFTDTVEGYTAS